MSDLTFTLVSDGPSDQALLPALHWLLRRSSSRVFSGEWPDLRRLPRRIKGLNERIRVAVELAPCDLLFVHRDAEGVPAANRVSEITAALGSSGLSPVIPVVPVRMTEAWLVWHEPAIRRAAGNPRGSEPLALPATHHVEACSDPKALLREALRTASGLGRRRTERLRDVTARIVADHIEDFSPLLTLPSFSSLAREVAQVIARHGWA